MYFSTKSAQPLVPGRDRAVLARVFGHDTVDGRNPTNQLRLVVYPIIYRVSCIPGGARFQPSTVGQV